jgi:protein SCO1/2
MNDVSPKVQWTVWGGLVLIILTILVIFISSRMKQSGSAFPNYGRIPDFTLTNQFGDPVTSASLAGMVWVADIIFTRCPGPCAQITKRMSELQIALPPKAPVRLISLTTDPEFDHPEVLKTYGDRFGAEPDRWWFLTGRKDEIARLAIDGLKLTALEKSPQERTNAVDLFIHSTVFVVVDKKGHVRGIVESLEPGAKEKAIEMVEALVREK